MTGVQTCVFRSRKPLPLCLQGVRGKLEFENCEWYFVAIENIAHNLVICNNVPTCWSIIFCRMVSPYDATMANILVH